MRKVLLIIILYLCFVLYGFANSNNDKKAPESKIGMLYDYKDTNYKFDNCDFYARLSSDYQSVKIKYQSKSYTKDFSLICDSYVEQVRMIKVEESLFWIVCESLGFEQMFILNLDLDKVFEPFFDMKNRVYVSKIDYNNLILFGDTWNSDKGIMPNQKIELYLFSTFKQTHYKIDEKFGETFNIKLLGNNILQYNDNNGKIVQFDYSDWVIQNNNSIKYGVSYNYPSEYGSIIINEDSYSMKSLSGKEGIITETYKSKISEKNNYTWLENTEVSNKKYIILSCSCKNLDFLTLVCSGNSKENYLKNWEIYYNYHDDSFKYNSMPWLRGFEVKKADSFLVEKLKDGTELKYLPEFTWVSEIPWATKGDSSKKKIYLKPNSPMIYNAIVIANGFICFDKPYLYEQNSRAKTIRISWDNKTKDFELKDTPNFQTLVLSDSDTCYDGNIQLEILDVYKGSKYSDVVISGIYYIGCN